MHSERENIRAFIAIDIDDDIKDSLCGLTNKLKEALGEQKNISWVKAESMHLTLKFFEELEQSRICEISDALDDAARAVGRFDIELGDIGTFPSTRQPRVVWVGLKESNELTTLKERIEDELEACGIEREERKFRPHLTLCRVRSKEAGRKIGRVLDRLSPSVEGTIVVKGVVLYRSILGPGGAEHRELKTITL